MDAHPKAPATLAAIHHLVASMPAAQARVAQVFLERPEEALRLSVASLAHEAGAGEASVIRFCRNLGYDNLRDLRVALASDLAYRRRDAPDGNPDLVGRLCAALRATGDEIDRTALGRVACALRSAPHVDIFGSGVSGMGTHLFAYRFSRIGLVARAWNDEIVADEVLASRRPGSVAMIVSETGLTRRTARFLEQSRKAGAFTVAVCGQAADELRALCDEVLRIAPLAPLPERGELAPLLGKLMLCDWLAAEIQDR